MHEATVSPTTVRPSTPATSVRPSAPATPALRTPWTPADYGLSSSIRRGGAWKLSDSGVAPLVAQARPYSVLTSADEAKAAGARVRSSLTARQVGNQLTSMLHDGLDDVLVLPWYSASSVSEDGRDARAGFTQFRPSTPEADAGGKIVKYKSMAGSVPSLDIHPATPASWLDGSDARILTEGLLKADSILSAQLLEIYGADRLAIVGSMEEARTVLSELMESMPRFVRTLVVAAAGVTMWDYPHEWRAINLRGSRVVVAFDGDVAQNAAVWKQADRAMAFLGRKAGEPARTPELWGADVSAAALAAGFDAEDKIGMDEYLTRLGSWVDLTDHLLTENLPPEPAAIRDYSVGDWRVNPGCAAIVEELVSSTMPDGSKGQPHWVTRSHIGLELLEIRTIRMPSEDEMMSGRIIEDPSAVAIEEVSVRFHLLPHDGDAEFNEVTSVDAVLPLSALGASRPGDWRSLRLPAEVLAHAHYPAKDFAGWLAAAKASSAPKRVQGWATLGWVPTGTGLAFVTPKGAVARTSEEEASVVLGLTPATLPRVAAWGIDDVYREGTHKEWEARAVADIEEAVRIWFPAFRSQEVAAIFFAMMLRPTMPMRGDGSVLMLSGDAGAGKSFGAATCLQGWNGYSRAWHHKSLPGTADDTVASTEVRVSQQPIHVLDDLAPDSDAGRAASRESGVSRLIRSVFNGSSRGRMGDTPVPDARAHLIVTAENIPGIQSIRQRMWEVRLPVGGALVEGGREAIDAAAARGLWTRLTAHAIRGWVSGGLARGCDAWGDVMAVCQEIYDASAEHVSEIAEALLGRPVTGAESRQAEKAAAMIAPVSALASTYAYAASTDDSATLAFLDKDLPELLTGYAMKAAKVHAQNTPGRLALKAVGLLLETGRAHLQNPIHPEAELAMPMEDRVAAGWQRRGDNWVAQGEAIGYLGTNAAGEKVVILNSASSFSAAKKAYPEFIPGGSSSAAAWSSLAGEKEILPTGATEALDRPRVRASAESSDTARLRGVVVRWEALRALVGDAADLGD